jgi:hypothetical protein
MTFNWTLPYMAAVGSLTEKRRSASPPGAAKSTPAPAAAPTATPTPTPTPSSTSAPAPLPPLDPKRYSTPHDGAADNADGSCRLATIQGIDVDLLPDARDTSLAPKAAATTIESNYVSAKWEQDPKTGAVTITPPSMHFTIQTSYGEQAGPDWLSQYGRGTLPEEVDAGKNTLEFHEGSHGAACVQYLRDHPLPVFELQPGATIEQYRVARDTHEQAMNSYVTQMRAAVERDGDCVGTPAGPSVCGTATGAAAAPTPTPTPAAGTP